MIATITRQQVYQTRGRSNYRVAWKYLYSVLGLPAALSGFDRLASAERMAKSHGATSIVREWEQS